MTMILLLVSVLSVISLSGGVFAEVDDIGIRFTKFRVWRMLCQSIRLYLPLLA